MSSVVFSYSEFIGLFPHISAAVTAGTLNESGITATYDSVADWLGADDDNSLYPYDPENNITIRKDALYLATCHIITLDLWSASGQSGRIASASQGSVSTSFDLLKSNKDVANYWFQTPCGQRYWMMTLSYRRGGRVYIHKNFHPWG